MKQRGWAFTVLAAVEVACGAWVVLGTDWLPGKAVGLLMGVVGGWIIGVIMAAELGVHDG